MHVVTMQVPRGVDDMALETLYTPDQVAEYLGVNRATVYVYLEHGDLKGKKVGLRKWIITESALKAFVADEVEDTGLGPLYTPDQVAEYLGVNRATIYAYLEHGDLKGKKVGLQKWIITESALKAFVADEDEAKAQAARHRRLLDYIAKLAEAGELDADRDPAARDRVLSDIEKRLEAGEFDADPDAL